HRAPDRTAVDQFSLEDDFVIPGGEVLTLRGHSAVITRHMPRLRHRVGRSPVVSRPQRAPGVAAVRGPYLRSQPLPTAASIPRARNSARYRRWRWRWRAVLPDGQVEDS